MTLPVDSDFTRVDHPPHYYSGGNMDHQHRTAVVIGAVVGAMLIVAALVFGFSVIRHPFTVLTTTTSERCGSALGGMPKRPDFTGLSKAGIDTNSMQQLDDAMNPLADSAFVADCKGALAVRQAVTWALLAPGLVLLVISGAGFYVERRRVAA